MGSYVLYPDCPWYRRFIISNLTACSGAVNSTLVCPGVYEGNWCMYCEDATETVQNRMGRCYPTNYATCDNWYNYNLPAVPCVANGWDVTLGT